MRRGSLGIIGLLVIVYGVASAQSWEFVRPYPQGNTYHDAESDGAGKVYMVGDGGAVTVFDGQSLVQLHPPSDKALFGISILAPNDIWIAGGDNYAEDPADQPVILHYDGQTWTEHPGPDGNRICNDIYAAGKNDVYVCAELSRYFWHYNGSTWRWIDVLPSEVEGSLNRFFGFGPNDIYVVGNYGQILHYDGNAWTLERKTETGGITYHLLYNVWGPDPEHVYACGNWLQVLKREAGGTWTTIHEGDPNMLFPPAFNALWETSAGDLYAAGAEGLYLYQGDDFVKIQSGLPYVDFNIEAMATAPDGNGAILAGFKGGLWQYRNGAVTPLTIPGRGPDFTESTDGAAFGEDFVLMGLPEVRGREDMHYLYLTEGNALIPFPQPTPSENMNRVLLVAGSPQTDIWLATERLPYYNNITSYWNGSAWQDVIYYQISAIYPLGNHNAYFFNGGGMFSFFNGAIEVIDDTLTDVSAVFGRSANDIYMVGEGGAAYYFNGTTVTAQSTGVTDNLTAMAGDADEVYAVGENRTAIYRKGGSWKRVTGLTSRASDHFRSIVDAGNNVFYAVLETPTMYIGGDRGEIYKFQNGALVNVRKGYSLSISGLGKTAKGKVLGWGERGLMMELTDDSNSEYASIVDPGANPSQALGQTGVTVDYAGDDDAQLVHARVYSASPSGLGLEDVPTVEKYWSLASSAASVTATVSIQYDPATFPEGANLADAWLYRNDGDGWKAVASDIKPESQSIQTIEPSGFSLWTIGFKPLTSDLNADDSVDMKDLILLIRSMKGQIGNKDLSGDGMMGYGDLFRFGAEWNP